MLGLGLAREQPAAAAGAASSGTERAARIERDAASEREARPAPLDGARRDDAADVRAGALAEPAASAASAASALSFVVRVRRGET